MSLRTQELAFAHGFDTAVDVKLNGDNYKVWAGTVRIILSGLDLLSHIDGTPPVIDAASSEASSDSSVSSSSSSVRTRWILDDRRTSAILSQSLEPDVRMEIFHLTTAQAIWDHLQQMFEHSSTLRHYALAKELAFAQQGDRSVREFATYFRSLWRQEDFFSPSAGDGCHCCQAIVRNREKRRTFEFLIRLQPIFEPVRSQIVNRDPVPSFDTVVDLVIAEEIRMQSPSVFSPSVPTIVIASHQSAPVQHSTFSPRPSPTSSTAVNASSSSFCRYCKKRGHLRDQCPKLQRHQLRASALRSSSYATSTETFGSTSSATLTTQVAQLTKQMQALQRALQTGASSTMSTATDFK